MPIDAGARKRSVGRAPPRKVLRDAADDAAPEAPPRPDLEVRAVLGVINNLNRRRRLDKYSVAAGRRDLRRAAAMAGSREDVSRVFDRTLETSEGPVPVRIYLPAESSEALPTFVWFHGGGFALGCLEMADGTCRAIANRSGAAVVSVDYRLAPEHDMSAGRRDCIAVVSWIREHGATVGLDPRRIAIGGDSAGGNLSAVVAQHCAGNDIALELQVLVYPATDLRIDYGEHPLAEDHLLTFDVMKWLKGFIPDDLDSDDPWLSPALAKTLKGVAPALVVTAGCDPLKDDGLAYVARLRADGVRVQSLHYPGQIHGFVTFDLILHAARDALMHIGNAVAQAFARSPAERDEAEERAFGHRWQTAGLRQRLTELHFDQIVLSQFLVDAHRFMLGRIGVALWQPAIVDDASLAAPPPSAFLAPRRFAEAVQT
jgi:acetyl esterase